MPQGTRRSSYKFKLSYSISQIRTFLNQITKTCKGCIDFLESAHEGPKAAVSLGNLKKLVTGSQTYSQVRQLSIINYIQLMCSCLLEGIGCCISSCCKDTVEGCSRGLGKQKVTKICYLFLVIIFTVPAIAILFFINKWSSYTSHFDWMSCPSSSGAGQFDCIGPSTVFRISLSFLCLFGSMLIFMLCRNAVAMCLNEGFFCLKYLIVLGIFIAFLFAPNDSFNRYSTASKYISIAFMAVQSIILVDLFYLAGIKLVARYDGDTCCGVLLITLTLVFEGSAVFLNVLGYIYFSEADACGSSLWVNLVTSIVMGILPLFQLLNFNKQNSLLTTSLVSLYISYLAFICQYSYGGDTCSSRISVNSIAADIIVSTFVFILTMYGSIMGGTGQLKISENANLNQAMGVAPTGPQNDGQKANNYQLEIKPKQGSAQKLHEDAPQNEQTNLAKYSNSYDWIKWHVYMCLASIYIGMLVTNWTSASLTTGSVTSSGFGFWVRVAISWFTALLYVWTLIAPKVFPDRDFTVV